MQVGQDYALAKMQLWDNAASILLNFPCYLKAMKLSAYLRFPNRLCLLPPFFSLSAHTDCWGGYTHVTCSRAACVTTFKNVFILTSLFCTQENQSRVIRFEEDRFLEQ